VILLRNPETELRDPFMAMKVQIWEAVFSLIEELSSLVYADVLPPSPACRGNYTLHNTGPYQLSSSDLSVNHNAYKNYNI